MLKGNRGGPAWWLLIVACAAASLAACGSDGPRWAKWADQIDRAAWVAACGPAGGSFTDDSGDFTGNEPGWTSESFKTEPATGSTEGRHVRGV